MEKEIENIIKKNLPEKKVETWIENCCPMVDKEAIAFNQVLSQINTSLIADEVLKELIKTTKIKLEQYIIPKEQEFPNAKSKDWIDGYKSGINEMVGISIQIIKNNYEGN